MEIRVGDQSTVPFQFPVYNSILSGCKPGEVIQEGHFSFQNNSVFNWKWKGLAHYRDHTSMRAGIMSFSPDHSVTSPYHSVWPIAGTQYMQNEWMNKFMGIHVRLSTSFLKCTYLKAPLHKCSWGPNSFFQRGKKTSLGSSDSDSKYEVTYNYKILLFY